MSKKKLRKNCKGFTLIELSIVIVISAVLFVTCLQAYEIYLKGQRIVNTYDTMDTLNNALTNFYGAQKRYPCPAAPALSPTSAQAGVEDCGLLLATGSCANGLCKAAGRDAFVAGTPDDILIGAIPYKTLKLGLNDLNPTDGIVKDDIKLCNDAFFAGGAAAATALAPTTICPTGMLSPLKPRGATNSLGSIDSLDGWHNKMTYAVSARLASNAPGSFDVSYGAITVNTELGIPLSDPPGSVMWALVSHGADGNGAYTYSGVQKPCGAVSKDVENCNNDNIFINGISSLQAGANYFDDLTYSATSRISSLWTNAKTNVIVGSNEQTDIVNRNIGNVGIGLVTPATERLEVVGKIKAANVMTTKICDSTGLVCFLQGSYGGAIGNLCPTTPPVPANNIRVMKKISGGDVQCIDVPMMPTISAQSCPIAGQAMKGVNNLGVIICGVP